MMKFLVVCFVSLSIVSISLPAYAQNRAGEERAKPSTGGPRRQLATILFAGLGGAILGLSTLSFYGRPQDKLENIAIGFAFGVIAGTSYVTYKAATRPDEFYAKPSIEEYELQSSRFAMAQSQTPRPMSLGVSFSF
jgi:hypothetical protein